MISMVRQETPGEAVARRQQERFRQLRKLLKPTEVRLHHVPNWFRRRLLKVFGCSHGYTGGWFVLDHARKQHFGDNARWLDHWGSTKYRSGTAFVSEPYQVSPETVALLDSFAKRIGVDWHLSANSWWYPGWTIRILFCEQTGARD